MGLFSRKREAVHVRGLTAAATSVDLTDEKANARAAAQQRKRPLDWQRDAWRYYDELPEVRGYGRWMGDMQSRVRLFPAIASEDPEQQATPATDADGVSPGEVDLANELLDRLRSPDGDRPELQRIFGVNLAIPGETWLVGTDEDPEHVTADNPTGERWRAFSNEEVIAKEKRWGIQPWPNARDQDVEWLDPDTSTLVHIYRAHGRWRNWPDSAMRSANIICEELLIATQSILGVLRSRMAAGILPIPAELELDVGDGDGEDEGTAAGDDPVLKALMKHFTTPVSDPRSAASIVPYLLKLPDNYLDKIKPIDVAKSIDPELLTRIEYLGKRFASLVDMPPEALLGLSDVNHWTGWLVSDDAARSHVRPYSGLYADAITTRYLRPRMEAAGVRDVGRWLLDIDVSPCVARPDEKDNAIAGWDRLALSDSTLVKALGYSDGDQPDEEERARRLAEGQRPKTTLNQGEQRQPTPNEGPPAGGMTAAAAPRSRDIGHRWAAIEARLLRDVLLDSDAALRRMLERAQAKVRNAARRDSTLRAMADAAPVDRLAVALGPEVVRGQLALGDDDLFAGGLGALGARFVTMTARARAQAIAELRRVGADPDPDLLDEYEARSASNAEEGAAVLVAGLTAAAGALLFSASDASTPQVTVGESDALLAASPRDVRAALTVAGGGPVQMELPFGLRVPETAAGMLAGQDFRAFLEQLPTFDQAGWLWEAGAPTHPFEPHQDLDGVEFSSWDDERLAWDPSEFPFVSVLSPQDHPGCQCILVPTGTVTVDDEPPEEGE